MPQVDVKGGERPAATQPAFYTPEGVELRPEQVPEALAKGEARTEKGANVYVRKPTGELATVSGDALYQALSAGATVEHPDVVAREVGEKRKTTGERVIDTAGAAVSGALSGATLGDFERYSVDHALHPEQAAQELSGLKKNHPLAWGGGEAVGTLAPALLGGGAGGAAGEALSWTPAGVAARVGTAAEGGVERGLAALGYDGSGMLARMGARAASVGASGAASGAFYGAGQAVSETALANDELTTDKVLSGAYHGALFGGVTGAALGAAGSAVSSGIEKITAGQSIKDGAQKMANRSALDAAGFRGAELRRLGKSPEAIEAKIDQMGGDLLNYEFKTGPLAGEKLFKSARKAEDLLDDVTYAKNEVGAEYGKMKQEVDAVTRSNPELAPDTKAYIQRVKTEVIDPLLESKSPTVRAQAQKVANELWPLDQAQAAGEQIGFADLDKFRKDLRSVFQPPRPPGGGMPAPVPEHAVHLEKAERILADELDQSAERALTETGGDVNKFRELRRQYGSFADIEKAATKRAFQDMGNRKISPSDYAMGMGSAMAAIATGNVGAIGALLKGAAATAAHKLIRERGQSVLAVLANNVAKLDGRIDMAAKALAGVAETPKRTLPALAIEGSEWAKHFEHAAQAVQNFQGSPAIQQQVLTAQTQAIAPEYPDLASSIQRKIMGDYAYLASKLPAPLSRAGASLTPQATKPVIPRGQQLRFMAAAAALNDPVAVIEQIAHGQLPRDGIDALKARRPELFSQVQQKIITYTTQRRSELPYARRVQLSIAFDFKGDKSLEPANIRALQSSNVSVVPDQAQPMTAQGQPPARQPAGGAHLSPHIAESVTLPSQKALGG